MATNSQCLPRTVVLIYFDDKNDWIEPLGGYPGVITPNLSRLASAGVAFQNAYCTAPVCNASRCSLLLGRYPHEIGIFGNREWIFDRSSEMTLVEAFKAGGYKTVGRGKIFHTGVGREGREDSEPRRSPVWDDYWSSTIGHADRGGDVQAGLSALSTETSRPSRYEAFDWGVPSENPGDYRDHAHIDSAIEALNTQSDVPICLAVGLEGAHIPWFAPRSFFDLYPLSAIRAPNMDERDGAQVSPFAREKIQKRGDDHSLIKRHGLWRDAVQAYLACISFVDFEVGRLLDAIYSTRDMRETLIVAVGDHGFHLGEKLAWRKSTLWEEATRTPLIVAGAGVAKGSNCRRIVSLVDVFPTLAELARLPTGRDRSGVSFVPLLSNPKTPWRRRAFTTWKGKNNAIRTERYRYIKYADGSEELYDHKYDNRELQNRIGSLWYWPVRRRLSRDISSMREK